MSSPTWHQNVLLVSKDPELKKRVTDAFGKESSVFLAADGDDAIQTMELNQFKVFIIDDQCLPDDTEKWVPGVSVKDLCSEAHENHDRPKMMVLSERIHKLGTDFLKETKASLVMNREHLDMNRIIYLIRMLRNRTYRTILSRDFIKAKKFNCPLYRYLPETDEYQLFLKKDEVISSNHLRTLIDNHTYHLFVKENELHEFLKSFDEETAKNLFSGKMNDLRKKYREFLLDFCDDTKIGKPELGKVTKVKGMAVINELQDLINSFDDVQTCIHQLPYPRLSDLAHGLNTAIYALIFGKLIEKKYSTKDVALAALIHNIGVMDVDQEIVMKDHRTLSNEESEQYQKHVDYSVSIAKRHPPFDEELFKNVLQSHHENFDGSGYPEGLPGKKIPDEAALVAICSTYNYLKTLKPKEGVTSPKEAFEKLMKIQGKENNRYSSSMLSQIAPLFNFVS